MVQDSRVFSDSFWAIAFRVTLPGTLSQTASSTLYYGSLWLPHRSPSPQMWELRTASSHPVHLPVSVLLALSSHWRTGTAAKPALLCFHLPHITCIARLPSSQSCWGMNRSYRSCWLSEYCVLWPPGPSLSVHFATKDDRQHGILSRNLQDPLVVCSSEIPKIGSRQGGGTLASYFRKCKQSLSKVGQNSK